MVSKFFIWREGVFIIDRRSQNSESRWCERAVCALIPISNLTHVLLRLVLQWQITVSTNEGDFFLKVFVVISKQIKN